jgi:Tfp pilus assembly protein PilO
VRKTPDPKPYFILAGITLVGGMGFLFMQNKSLGSLRSKVSLLSEQAREQKQIYMKLADTQKDLADLQVKLSHLEQGVPEAAFVPTMLKELEDAGKQRSIEVLGVRPVTVKGPKYGKDPQADEDKPYEPLDLELKGKGLYTDLVGFVRGLNTFPKIVAVRTVSIAPPVLGPKDADKRLDLTLGLRAFVFKQSGDDKSSPDPKQIGNASLTPNTRPAGVAKPSPALNQIGSTKPAPITKPAGAAKPPTNVKQTGASVKATVRKVAGGQA